MREPSLHGETTHDRLVSEGAPDPPSEVFVPIPGPLTEARFVERPNRFVVRCRLPARAGDPDQGGPADSARRGGRARIVRDRRDEPRVVAAHLADPGRLTELLVPDARVWLRAAAAPHRKTDWSAVLVEAPDDGWSAREARTPPPQKGGSRGPYGRDASPPLVSVDTTLPNRLIRAALEADALDELAGWHLDRAEWSHGASRFDFLLTREQGARRLVLEVKSVTLVEGGVGLFPDAVTARGARHVRELTELAARPDFEAAVLFVLQRPDARRILAARSIDPDFADALAEAKRAGVRVLGRRCRVRLEGVTLGEAVPAG